MRENVTPHSTKKGPGRRHVEGTKHGKPPVAPKGRWLPHNASPAKRARRALIAKIGIRQFKRQQRAEVAA